MSEPNESFQRMSERILHNRASPTAGKFGGAAVILPPEGGGEPIEILIDDLQGDPAQFYSTLMTRIQLTLEGIKENQRKTVFGR